MPPISKTGNDRFSKILFWVGILIIPTILITQVLVYQPFFAHLDDARHLEMVRTAPNIWAIWGNFANFWPSRSAGWLTNSFFYIVGSLEGSTSMYLTSIAFLLACLFLFAIGLQKSGVLPRSLLITTVAVLASLLWPFTYELVFFTSLVEDSVVLFVGLILVLYGRQTYIPRLASISLLAGFFVLTIYSKNQALLFMPALFLLAVVNLTFRKERNSRLFWGVATIAPILSAFVILRNTTQPGSYEAGTAQEVSVSALLATAQTPYALLILGIVVVYGVYLGVRFLRGSRNYLELVPLVMMATFWASIVYFGYRNYFLSIFGVMFGSAVAMVVGNLKSVKLQQLATVGLIVVTVGWTLYRIPQVFEPLHGIGAFTQGQIAKDLADEGAVIYTSCVEGSGHFNYYTEHKWGVTPEFRPLEGDGAGYRLGIPDDGQYVFGDRRLCAAPGEIAAWDVIWASPGDDGFRLYKRPA
jgi:hypothetical protein